MAGIRFRNHHSIRSAVSLWETPCGFGLTQVPQLPFDDNCPSASKQQHFLASPTRISIDSARCAIRSAALHLYRSRRKGRGPGARTSATNLHRGKRRRTAATPSAKAAASICRIILNGKCERSHGRALTHSFSTSLLANPRKSDEPCPEETKNQPHDGVAVVVVVVSSNILPFRSEPHTVTHTQAPACTYLPRTHAESRRRTQARPKQRKKKKRKKTLIVRCSRL
jgi:hypothetical protein